jgi:cellulase/cellobiase CelA1
MENKQLLNDELMDAISGGTVEETKELLDWCNRHGANLTCSPESKYAGHAIFNFLVTNYPELHLNSAKFRPDKPNAIDGYRHAKFMERLRKKYGD